MDGLPAAPPLPLPLLLVAGALAPPEADPAVPELEVPPEVEEPANDAVLEALAADVVEVGPVAPVVPVVPVAAAEALTAPEVGTVIGGAAEPPAVPPPAPQAARPSPRDPTASSMPIRDLASTRAHLREDQEPSGCIRRPQWGQSFRSFWQS